MMANDLTLLLNRMTGQPVTAEELLPLVYAELPRLAAQKMAGEVPGQTLQATALVHEAWLRLGGGEQSWENRAHFFGAAAEAMRRILVDRARSRRAERHGGGLQRVPLERVEIQAPADDEELLELHEALGHLAAVHPEKAEQANAPVVVATLETQRERLLRGDGPKLLVIDEYQMLADPVRGMAYEMVVALAPLETRLLLLSGRVANARDGGGRKRTGAPHRRVAQGGLPST